MNQTVDCIIPFYNEGQRVISVVKTVTQVRNLSKIIAVDDGSTETGTFNQLHGKFPGVISLRLDKNIGKAGAVKAGLSASKAKYVLLLDGDLTNIKINELEDAISKISVNYQIDMIILRRVDDNTSLPWLRQDIITSGQRILLRRDLENIFQNNISCYQLEVAINSYMVKNHKNVYWMPFSIHGPWRSKKWGRKDSLKQILRSARNYLHPAYLRDIVWQSLYFCKKVAP